MIVEPMPGAGRADPYALGVLSRVAERSAGQAGAENFPVALRVLPARPRAHLMRVYGFARFVDDVGDEAPGDRSALLLVVAADLRALPDGLAELAPVAALAPLLAETTATLQEFLDLVAANEQDQTRTSYADFDDLLAYCRLSAAPVGRLVLHVAGAATADNIADSDAVCAALQVLEHCQDVAEDALRGRVYLPADELGAAGLTTEALLAGTADPALRAVIADQVDRCRTLLAQGHPLVGRLKGWSRLAVAGYLAGGYATADALRASGYDPLAQRVRPSRGRTVWHAARVVVRAGR